MYKVCTAKNNKERGTVVTPVSMMSKFDEVKNVWDDLETAYIKKGNGKSRTEFLKALILYQKGEVGTRNLTAFVARDRGDATDEEFEELIAKFDFARQYLDSGKEIATFEDFFSQKHEVSIYDFDARKRDKIIDVRKQIKTGSILPMLQYRDSKIHKDVVREYIAVCDTPEDLFVFILDAKENPKNKMMLKTLLSFIKEKRVITPFIYTDECSLKALCESFKSVSVHEDNIVKMYKVTDKYSDVYVLAYKGV